jgi:hypothetical protein
VPQRPGRLRAVKREKRRTACPGEKNGCPAEADSRADVSGFAGWPGPAAGRFQDCHDVYGMVGKEAGKRAGRETENGGGEKADK